MKKILLLISALLLIALSYLFVQKQDVSVENDTYTPMPLPVITHENVKAMKKAQIEQMANDLYIETDQQLKNGEPIKFDDETIYDDIKKVDIKLEIVSPEFDIGITSEASSDDMLNVEDKHSTQ